jgi:glutamate--cysteine ligase
VPYLFGASPAICKSFLQGRKSDLQEMGSGTMYYPHATSLRMSDLGYQNRAQANLQVSFNSLAEYTDALERAIRTPDPFTRSWGCAMATIGNSSVPTCCRSRTSSTPPCAPSASAAPGTGRPRRCASEGVEYVEMRLYDLNPMQPIGIAPEQGPFADVLLLMCLFRDSPPISAREQAENAENKRRVVNRGRQNDLHLLVHNREQALRPLAHELFDDMAPFAAMLDAAYGNQRYSQTPADLRQRIDQPELTPSAQVLEGVRQQGSFYAYAMDLSRQHKATLLGEQATPATQAQFEQSVRDSLAQHAQIEAAPQGPFADYVAAYYA